MRGIAMMLCLGLLAPAAMAAPAITGHWEGDLVRQGVPMAVSFDFTGDPKLAGRYTSLTQRAMDYPLDTVAVTGDDVHFVLGGDMAFDGQEAGDAITGTFKEGDGEGTFALHRVTAPVSPYHVEDVSFRNGDVTLSGTLVEPQGPGPFPAVVLLQGSGPESRWGTNRYIADRLARAGVAALIYDKRGSGQSGGDWTQADYDDLARDALAGVDLLRTRPEIDPHRIGLHGHSQGGIVAPDAARLAPDKIAFIIAEDTVAGPVWQQDIYRVKGALAQDFPADQAEAALKLYSLFIDVARDEKPYDDLAKAEDAAKQQPWYDWLGLPPKESWLWPWYLKTGTVDTLAYWKSVHVPVLLAYGEQDALVPVGDSVSAIGATLAAGNTPYTAVIVPGAQHNLTIHPTAGQPFFWWHGAPGYYDLVAAWARTAADNN